MRWLLLVGLIGLLLSGCGAVCRLKGCTGGATELQFVDASGNRVSGVRGTATFNGAQFSFDCSRLGECPGGVSRWHFEAGSGPIEVDVEAGALAFKGAAMSTPTSLTFDDYNGPGCGSCTVPGVVAVVTLQAR